MVRQEFHGSFGSLKGHAPEGKQVAMQHLPSKEAYSSVSLGCAKNTRVSKTTASYTGRSMNTMIDARCARGAYTSAMMIVKTKMISSRYKTSSNARKKRKI